MQALLQFKLSDRLQQYVVKARKEGLRRQVCNEVSTQLIRTANTSLCSAILIVAEETFADFQPEVGTKVFVHLYED